MKKILATVICVLLLVMSIPPTISASETEGSNLYRDENYIFEIVNDCEISIHYYIGKGETVIVPSSIGGLPVKSIGKWAFFNTEVKEVFISEGITELSDETFYNCPLLETVSLPSTLESTGTALFRFCQSLKSVTFSGEASNPILGDYLFYACNSLENVNIPDDTTNIPDGMFAYCQSLETVTLPENTKSISDYAFYASGLSSIVLPESLNTIGDMAFADCATLDEIINLREGCNIVSDNAFSGTPAGNPYEGADTLEIYFTNTLNLKDIYAYYYLSEPDENGYYWGKGIEMTFFETNAFGQDVYKVVVPKTTSITFSSYVDGKETFLQGCSEIIDDNNAFYIKENSIGLHTYVYSPDINPLDPSAPVPEATPSEATEPQAKTNLQPVSTSSPDEFSGHITDKGFLVGASFDEVVTYEKGKIVTIGALVESDVIKEHDSATNVRKRGDSNCDQKIDVRDATIIQKYSAGLITINSSDFEYKNSDVNCDGAVNVKDATHVQKFLVEIVDISDSPIELA